MPETQEASTRGLPDGGVVAGGVVELPPETTTQLATAHTLARSSMTGASGFIVRPRGPCRQETTAMSLTIISYKRTILMYADLVLGS